MGITRRQFIQLTGASAAGAVAFAACAPPAHEILVESRARMPEDLVTGIDTWYATICRMCPSGCGIIVRVMEGRAKKIEGNPAYPVNRGKLCARGQSGLQALYHPDRIRGPLRRTGPRGSGQFEPVSWDTAMGEFLGRLKPLRSGERLDGVTIIAEATRGQPASLLFLFVRETHGVQWAPYQHLGQSALRLTIRNLLSYQTHTIAPPLPHFDLANARFVLSFGADFLSSWLSPVQYGLAYGSFRSRPRDRGILVQVEPRMTSTGASADQWVPIKPGAEGALALGLAQVIVSEGLVSQSAAGPVFDSSLLQNYRPQAVSQITGVPEDRIIDLARRFAKQTPSLAIAGGPAAAHTNGRFNLEAVYSLNRLVGSVGRAGGVLANPPGPIPEIIEDGFSWSFLHLKELIQAMRTGKQSTRGFVFPPQALLVKGVNPVYDLPPSLGFREALDKVPFIASFSSFMDETTAMADLVLPEHTYLEDWGADIPYPGPGFQIVGFQQPVVNPLYDTRSFGDILLTLGEELGMGTYLPWKSFREAVRTGAKDLMGLRRGSVQATGFEEYWIRLLQQGGWWDERATGVVANPPGQAERLQPAAPSFAGLEQEYPYHLLPFPSASLGVGGGAHLPWLQAMPDPITTAVWMTWVEVNLDTANRLDLREGDVVRVESPIGSLEAPVYPHPGIRPDVVAIPMGQGHTAFGRYAQSRGANPLVLVDTSLQSEISLQSEGDLAWAATRVRLIKTGKTVRISKAEGSVTPVEPSDVDIVGVTRQ